MKRWQPTKLHFLLGDQVEWTDELWEKALAFVSQNLATPQAMCMETVLPKRTERIFFKIDYLRRFRNFPPLTMLYAYDFQRLYFKTHPLGFEDTGEHLPDLVAKLVDEYNFDGRIDRAA